MTASEASDALVALQDDFQELRQGYVRERYPTLEVRRRRLQRLRSALSHYRERFVQAISEDFSGRADVETLGAEVLVADQAIQYLHKHLRKWMRPEERHISLLFAPAYGEVVRQPKGVVGVIAPWNYPLQLALVPIATALAAGNRVMLKPSELSPATSALLTEMLHATFPADLVKVVVGGVDVGQAFSKLPFDHLFFTGSTSVGRIVLRAAAENLVPVTLELGGKSPAILHPGASMSTAVERIAWAKCLNAGQTCVAPDYVLVPRSLETTFVREIGEQIRTFYPSFRDNPDYTAIINDHHRKRIEDLVREAEAGGAVVTRVSDEAVEGTRKLVPTIVQQAPLDSRLMQDEIFGPVLPVVPYDTFDEALAFVNDRPRPLALYYFDQSRKRTEVVLKATVAGAVCVNDCAIHVGQDDLPFGGIGPSGMGSYHGREGFESMSHGKAVFHQRRVRFTQLFNPPYGRAVRTLLRALLR